MSSYKETIYDSYAQMFTVEESLHRQTTEHFDLQIFKNHKFGRVMALDGIIQTTEADEFIYHEMLSHVPILAHGAVRRVLIVGGGDGGMLREVLRHASVEQVVQVEIDDSVVEMSKRYLPQHSQGAFDDPRFKLVIDDGLNYLKTCQEKFDVIISDATDPIGPGAALFSQDFYENCSRCLTEDGVLVTQNGVAFFQLQEAVDTAQHLQQFYADWAFYSAAVPTYVGGVMLFGFASKSTRARQVSLTELQQRFQQAGLETRYYHPKLHQASFALPLYVEKALAAAGEVEVLAG